MSQSMTQRVFYALKVTVEMLRVAWAGYNPRMVLPGARDERVSVYTSGFTPQVM